MGIDVRPEYHAYAKEQPDLDWRNPDVRAQMHAVLRFLLDRGVDGFRLDAVARLIEDERFREIRPLPKSTRLGAPISGGFPIPATCPRCTRSSPSSAASSRPTTTAY